MTHQLTEEARPYWGWGRVLLRRSTLGPLALLVLVVVFAPWLEPYDPLAQDLMNRLAGPSASHWLGTDEAGRRDERGDRGRVPGLRRSLQPPHRGMC